MTPTALDALLTDLLAADDRDRIEALAWRAEAQARKAQLSYRRALRDEQREQEEGLRLVLAAVARNARRTRDAWTRIAARARLTLDTATL